MAFYIALGSLSGSTFTECTDANYVRRPAGLVYTGQGAFSVQSGTHWPAAAASYKVSAVAICDALSGGNKLYAWTVPTVTMAIGGVFNNTALDAALEMDDLKSYTGSATLIFDAGTVLGRSLPARSAIVAVSQVHWSAGALTSGT